MLATNTWLQCQGQTIKGKDYEKLVIDASYSEVHLLFNFSWKCGSSFSKSDSSTLVPGILLGLGGVAVIKGDTKLYILAKEIEN